jgi:hypothetical protein
MFTCIVNRSSVINLDLFWKQFFSYKINCSNFFQLSVELAKKNEGNHEAGTNVIKLFEAITYPSWKKLACTSLSKIKVFVFDRDKRTSLLLQSISCNHRYRKAKNRWLKFCYVPVTSAAQNRLLFFFCCGCLQY